MHGIVGTALGSVLIVAGLCSVLWGMTKETAKLEGMRPKTENTQPNAAATKNSKIMYNIANLEVMQAAAKSNLKTVSLELGGKSTLLIFDDADVDKAADLAFLGILYNKIREKFVWPVLQEGIYDELVKKLQVKAKDGVVGDPFDPNVHQGPQVDKKQFEKILTYIEHGKREGATLLTGGKPVGKKGYYIESTVFTDVKDDMLIAKDDKFGPVTSLMKFNYFAFDRDV